MTERIHFHEKPQPTPLSPEISLQSEIRESGEYEYAPSAAHWYWNMVDGTPFDDITKAKMLLAMKEERPYLVSAVMERACNLSCAHCLYQDEKSSAAASREAHLAEVIEAAVASLPANKGGKFMSVGRILRPWHLSVLTHLRETRPDVKLGVIDNGTFTKLLPKWPVSFKLDWIDISIDGTQMHHNEQRGSEHAYAEAINGLHRAREVVRLRSEGGYIASLMTLTNINAGDTETVADTLLSSADDEALADRINFTTMSPTNAINKNLEMDIENFRAAWEGLKQACAKYNTPGNERIHLGLYRIEDVEKLAAVVGERKFLESFPTDANEAAERVTFRGNFIETHIDGVPVSYLPISIWPPEELLIDADGAYRVAYEGQFTLEELHAGRSKGGRDTSAYTAAQLTPKTNFAAVYEQVVDHYWQHFGHKKLADEFTAFERIRSMARS